MIEQYLEYSSKQASPTLYHKWNFISAVAACLERNVWLDRGYYKVYPNLYVVLIGDSAEMMKSTSIEMVKEVLAKVENAPLTMYEGQTTLPALIENLGGMKLDPITGKQVPKSRIMLLAPELSLFLVGQEAPDKIKFLTDFYTSKSKPWTYGTKTKASITIEAPCINFLAASTSEWLAQGLSIGDFGGGFMGRCIFVVPTETKRVAHPSVDDRQRELFDKLVGGLQQIRTYRGEYQLSKKGYAFYETWYNSRPKIAATDKLKSYFERKADTVLKLGIIKTVLDGAGEVGDEQLQWGVASLGELEADMRNAFQFIGTAENVLAELIVNHLKQKGGSDKQSSVLGQMAPRLRGFRQFNDVIEMLKQQERITYYERGTDKYLALN